MEDGYPDEYKGWEGIERFLGENSYEGCVYDSALVYCPRSNYNVLEGIAERVPGGMVLESHTNLPSSGYLGRLDGLIDGYSGSLDLSGVSNLNDSVGLLSSYDNVVNFCLGRFFSGLDTDGLEDSVSLKAFLARKGSDPGFKMYCRGVGIDEADLDDFSSYYFDDLDRSPEMFELDLYGSLLDDGVIPLNTRVVYTLDSLVEKNCGGSVERCLRYLQTENLNHSDMGKSLILASRDPEDYSQGLRDLGCEFILDSDL